MQGTIIPETTGAIFKIATPGRLRDSCVLYCHIRGSAGPLCSQIAGLHAIYITRCSQIAVLHAIYIFTGIAGRDVRYLHYLSVGACDMWFICVSAPIVIVSLKQIENPIFQYVTLLLSPKNRDPRFT